MQQQSELHFPADSLPQVVSLLRALEAKVDAVHAVLGGQRKELLTVVEFADLVGRSSYTIRRWIAEGRVRAARVDGTGPRGRLLIPRSELDRVVQAGMAGNLPASAIG